MKMLFIGGCADGRRIEVPDGMQIYLVPYMLPLGHCGDSITPEETMPRCEYQRARFRDVDGDHEIMLLIGKKNPFAELIANYRPGVAVPIPNADIFEALHRTDEGISAVERGGHPDILIMKLPYVP